MGRNVRRQVRKCWGGDRQEGRDDEAEQAHHPDGVCPGSLGEGEQPNSGDEAGDRFYINTGTWRDVIPSTPDRRTFGRMRALTYVTLYAKSEQTEACNSFDYWTGFTKDWKPLRAPGP